MTKKKEAVEQGKPKAREQTKVNVLELLYEIGDVDSENYRVKQRVGYVYRAELGKLLGHAILFSPEQLGLGEQKIYVRKGSIFPGDYPIERVEHAHAIIGKDKRLRDVAMGISRRQDVTVMQAVCEALQDAGVSTYSVLQAVELDELQAYSKREINSIIEDYVCGGHEIAPELRSIMRASLVHFPPREENKDMMKYRPHALIIKATKSGVSTISARIGRNIDQISTKSVEGFATSDGQITHSSLHNAWGHVNIDEFLQMPEELFQHMFSFLEAGQYNTQKASRQITNYGAPRICFTANPQDIGGVSFSSALGGKETRIEGQETLPDLGKQRLAFATFKSALGKLTQVSSAAFSRLGVILFSPSLPRAVRVSAKTSKYYEDRSALAGSVVFWLSARSREIFDKNIEWLETPLDDYSKSLDKALAGCSDQAIKNAWAGQKDAYKHVRGQALSEAIIDNAYEVLQAKKIDEELLAKIREDAEECLKDTTSTNLESLGNILLSVKEFSKEPSVIRAEIDSSPSYVKPFLVAYALLAKKASGGLVRWDTPLLQSAFEGLGEAKRKELFGEAYSFWSSVFRRVDLERIKSTTRRIFGKPIIQGEEFIFDAEVAELVLSAYGLEVKS